MKRGWIAALALSSLFCGNILSAHCQMPCGIYHDDMVFDQIDQYIETMVKGISVMKDSKFETLRERNEFIRWVMTKDRLSDETAELITTYFLQQKIKPGEEDTPKRLEAAHRMLFLIVQIKQTPDIAIVKSFFEEWEKFKLMFHIESYECEIEKLKFEDRFLREHPHTHSHEHDHEDGHTHPHPVTPKPATAPKTSAQVKPPYKS